MWPHTASNLVPDGLGSAPPVSESPVCRLRYFSPALEYAIASSIPSLPFGPNFLARRTVEGMFVCTSRMAALRAVVRLLDARGLATYLPLRPAAAILDMRAAPYFFLPIAAATAPGLSALPLAAILDFNAANRAPLPSLGLAMISLLAN